MKMKFRIMMHKLLFMNHILHLGEDTLAKQIQVEQENHNGNGLTHEVKEFVDQLSLPDCFKVRIPIRKWKTLVKKAIADANEKEIRESSKTYKKMENKIEDEEKFKCKDYLTSMPLSQARTLFKHKYSMTEHVKMNYKGDPAFSKLLWKCQDCQNQDTEIHLLWCPAFEDIRDGLDLSSDKDLCSYLQQVIRIKSKENKK